MSRRTGAGRRASPRAAAARSRRQAAAKGSWRDALFGLAVVALMIGGGYGGVVAATRLLGIAGFSADEEAALAGPAAIGGIAVGGVGALLVMVGLFESYALVRGLVTGGARSGFTGTPPMYVSRCVLATVIGAVAYVALVGALCWVLAQWAPVWLMPALSVVLTIAGLPFVGPVAFQLITARRADEVPGGRPLPRWVYRVRRTRRTPTANDVPRR